MYYKLWRKSQKEAPLRQTSHLHNSCRFHLTFQFSLLFLLTCLWWFIPGELEHFCEMLLKLMVPQNGVKQRHITVMGILSFTEATCQSNLKQVKSQVRNQTLQYTPSPALSGCLDCVAALTHPELLHILRYEMTWTTSTHLHHYLVISYPSRTTLKLRKRILSRRTVMVTGSVCVPSGNPGYTVWERWCKEVHGGGCLAQLWCYLGCLLATLECLGRVQHLCFQSSSPLAP